MLVEKHQSPKLYLKCTNTIFSTQIALQADRQYNPCSICVIATQCHTANTIPKAVLHGTTALSKIIRALALKKAPLQAVPTALTPCLNDLCTRCVPYHSDY